MDALALHPYSTSWEQFARQIAVLRRQPELADMPIEITEFGSQDPERAADVFMRSYCQMSLAGVSRAVWYAVNPRGDGYQPLVGPNRKATQVSRSFAFARANLEGTIVQNVSPDPFTYACLFGENTLVIWGMPRRLTVTNAAIQSFDAALSPLAGQNFELSQSRPLVLISPEPLRLDRDFTLAPQRVLADSFHQFSFPADQAPNQAPDGFSRFLRSGKVQKQLRTMPGQYRSGTPWTPHLGTSDNPMVRLLPTELLPGGTGENPVEIVHLFEAQEEMQIDVIARFAPAERSPDGVAISVRLNGTELKSTRGKGTFVYEAKQLELAAGSSLEFVVGPNEKAKGDVTNYRITLYRSEL